MAGRPGIAARLFGALAQADVNIVAIAQGSSELNISFVVAGKDTATAQRAIHRAFQLSKIGGGAATSATHTDAVLLGFGQIGRTLAAIMAATAKWQGRQDARAQCRCAAFGWSARSIAAASSSSRAASAQLIAQLSAGKKTGQTLAQLPGGHAARPDEAVALLEHALTDPMLVDVTADDRRRSSSRRSAGDGRRARQQAPALGVARRHRGAHGARRARGQRVFYEATVGAGLPIFDTYRKLVESGDRVLKIEGCLSGTLGFLLTEVGRGRPFSQALAKAIELGYTEPDPRDDFSGIDVGRKALILGRLLDFAGEPADVAVESLVPEPLRALPRGSFLASLPTPTPNGPVAPPPRRPRAAPSATWRPSRRTASP